MKNNIIKIIFVFVLLIENSIVLFSQNLLNDPHWDNFNQGKDIKCNNLFESLLLRSVYNKSSVCSTFDFYSIGYLKNIDFYYVSYNVSDEASIDFITELYRISSKTDISSFDYTKTSTMINDSNKNHCVIWDMGKIDSFEDYLIFYDKRHVAVYKKSEKANEYISISDIGSSGHVDSEFVYDRINRQFVRKIFSLNGVKKEYSEKYKIINGEIIKLK